MFGFTSAVATKDITPAIIDKWESKYGEDFFRDDFEGKTAYFRVPSQKESDKAAKKLYQSGQPFTEFGCILATMKVGWLGGDIELLTNEKYLERMKILCQV